MRKRKRGVWLMVAGVLLLAAALGLTASNLFEERRAEKNAEHVLSVFQTEVLQGNLLEDSDQLLKLTNMQTVEIDGREYIGILEIPAINVRLPVMKEWSDPLLKVAPCLYKGSYLEDSMIIAGHNYKKHFANLSQLQTGDTISFTDVFNTAYTYQVSEKESLDGADVEGMEKGKWDLTLFTCTYGGGDRVTVRCRAI